MSDSKHDPAERWWTLTKASDLVGELDKPISNSWCVLGWTVSIALFILIIAILGGPSTVDSRESVFSTWFFQHGQLACAFPSKTPQLKPVIAPGYLIYSGLIASVAHIGSSIPFPHESVAHSRCTVNYSLLEYWAHRTGALKQTLEIGYSAWILLLVGIVLWLRSTGRGRCGWEPVTLIVVSSLTSVITCVLNYFHPQDVLALGLSLTALAFVRQGRWICVGVFIGLAVLTQQYTVLVAMPLLVVVPRDRRLTYLSAALACVCVVIVPLLIATSGTSLRALALGSGNNPNPAVGGSLVFSLGLHGVSSVLVTRLLPVLLALLFSLWVVHRLGSASLEPTALMSLVATCFALRLVFELAIFSYYFMALAVTLILIEVSRKRLRSGVIAWLASMTVVYAIDAPYSVFVSVPWIRNAQLFVPLIVIVITLLIVLVGIVNDWNRWNAAFALVTVGFTMGTWRRFRSPLLDHLPSWAWQLIFVGWGMALAAGPLLRDVRTGSISGGSAQTPSIFGSWLHGRQGVMPLGSANE